MRKWKATSENLHLLQPSKRAIGQLPGPQPTISRPLWYDSCLHFGLELDLEFSNNWKRSNYAEVASASARIFEGKQRLYATFTNFKMFLFVLRITIKDLFIITSPHQFAKPRGCS